MKVGITGHQQLGSEGTIAWLSSTLNEIISQYNIDMGLTSLAIGADQLYAAILKKNHIPYIVIVPSFGYEKTFADTKDLEKYKELLQNAFDKVKQPFEKPSELAFYEAGKKIVDLSDMLIAIWNGQPAKGLGGTGDIVQYAFSIDKPVIHINPIIQKVSVIKNRSAS